MKIKEERITKAADKLGITLESVNISQSSVIVISKRYTPTTLRIVNDTIKVEFLSVEVTEIDRLKIYFKIIK